MTVLLLRDAGALTAWKAVVMAARMTNTGGHTVSCRLWEDNIFVQESSRKRKLSKIFFSQVYISHEVDKIITAHVSLPRNASTPLPDFGWG